MSDLQIIQQRFGLLTGKKTESLVVGFNHFPCSAFGGERIHASPYSGRCSMVYCGADKGKNVVDGLAGKCFDGFFIFSGFGSIHAFCFGVPSGGFEELSLECGKQAWGQVRYGHGVDFGLEVGAILTIMLVDVLFFAFAPSVVRIDNLADCHLVALDGINSSGFKFSKEFCAGCSGGSWSNAFAMAANSFPVAFAFGVLIPESVDEVGLAGMGSRLADSRKKTPSNLVLLYFLLFAFVMATR